MGKVLIWWRGQGRAVVRISRYQERGALFGSEIWDLRHCGYMYIGVLIRLTTTGLAIGWFYRPHTVSILRLLLGGIYRLLQISKGGGGEILDLFGQILDLLKKLWTFQYAAGFRGPSILIKRSIIVDLSVYAAWLRGPDISQNIQKRYKKISKYILQSFHLAATATQWMIVPHATYQIFDLFGLSKFKGGNAPWPPW